MVCCLLCTLSNFNSTVHKFLLLDFAVTSHIMQTSSQLLLQKVENSFYRLEDTAKPHAQSTLYQWILAAPQDQAEPTLEK